MNVCGPWAAPPDQGLLLERRGSRLELRDPADPRSRPLFVDFLAGATAARRFSASSRYQPIARAVGLRGTKELTVWDATAGLLRDGFLLACLGCRVTAIERCPVLAALVEDGIRRAAGRSAALDPVLARMTLIVADARDVLAAVAPGSAPQVVYLDPMYAPTGKSALSGKEIRWCRRLVGDDRDADELLAVARTVARNRVVVKRHRTAAPLGPDPDVVIRGTTTRYDVYLRVPANSGSGASSSKSSSSAAS